MEVIVWCVVAVLVGGLLGTLVIDGGPKCETCGWTQNQCQESWHFAGKACCEKCRHKG